MRDTALGLQSRRQDVGIGVLDTILAAEAKGRTRVVLNLDTMVPYQTRVADNSIYVTLDGPSASGVSPTVAAAVPAVNRSQPTSTDRKIEAIFMTRLLPLVVKGLYGRR